MAALHRAFAFTEGNDAAVGIGEDLDFDVTRLFQIFFEIQAGVTEGVERFGGSVAPSGSEVGIAGDEAHAFSAAAGDRFQQNGIAHGLGESLSLFGLFDRLVGAGDSGNIGAARELAAGGFGAERFHGFGGRTDKDETGFFTGAGKRWIFGEEPVAGMNRVAAGAAGHVDQLVDAEITFARWSGTDGVGFVGETDMEGSAIGFAEDDDGADAKFAAGAEDANGDFAAIGDQDFVEHAGEPHLNTRVKTQKNLKRKKLSKEQSASGVKRRPVGGAEGPTPTFSGSVACKGVTGAKSGSVAGEGVRGGRFRLKTGKTRIWRGCVAGKGVSIYCIVIHI